MFEQVGWIVGRPTGLSDLGFVKTQRVQIKPLHERVQEADRVFRCNIVVE